MLITDKNILNRWTENLEWATEIDIAVAWATQNEALHILFRDRHPKVRAVIGLWNKITEPEALKFLAEKSDLRLVPDNKQRGFHPKVYLFRGNGRSVAWIGSANFTVGGFGHFRQNKEAVFETTDTGTVDEWFRHLWGQCTPYDKFDINQYDEEYKQSRERNKPAIPTKQSSTIAVDLSSQKSPMELMKGISDWRSYVNALKQCDQWWSAHYSFSVLGEQPSWADTIWKLHYKVKQKGWSMLDDDYDQQRLLGLTKKGGNWALLGNMRRPSKEAVFSNDYDRRRTIENAVLSIVDADDNEFPEVAVDAYKKLRVIPKIGQGIATRLLTLARPDHCVSMNGASRNGLIEAYGDGSAKLSYGEILEKIHAQPWYQEPEPEDEWERNIWQMRVALLDCFVYQPTR